MTAAHERIVRVIGSLLQSEESQQLLLEECSQKEGDEYFWLNPFQSKSNWVDIGGVRITCEHPIPQPERIPFKVPYPGTVCDYDSSELRSHLRWMMQKELLHQDMFLIGPPGPYRRWIAFMFCEFIRRPASYISLTRDTSESDLKQRREIKNSSAVYEDLLVVEAATKGHVLIIEGIEKCERNVLPVLNNLLENREMLLEDGRFLVNHNRYDQLLKESGQTKEYLQKLNLIRAHPNFRVIALGLPVPQFPGNPMDPPLRSRFQCRDVIPASIETHLKVLPKGILPKYRTEENISLMKQLISFSDTLQRLGNEEEQQLLPHFPDTPGILRALQILTTFPGTSFEISTSECFSFS